MQIMFIKRYHFHWVLVLVTLVFLNSSQITYGQGTLNANPRQNQVLSCSEVKSRINQMIDLHYSYREFNEELSQRTFSKFFENLDSGKIFLTVADINQFKHLKLDIGKKISENNCNFIFNIHDMFKNRVQIETQKAIQFLEDPFIFSSKMSMETGKLNWAKNEKELNLRLKKRILFQYLSLKQKQIPENEIRNKIKVSYIKFEKKYENMSNDKIYSLFLNSFAQSLDPHSSHMLPAEQDSFSIHISNKLEGIGAQLKEEDGLIVVKSLILGGVAQKDGRLKVGDILVAVDAGNGEGLQDMAFVDVEKAVELIRGKKGTEAKLVVLRKSTKGNEKINISLMRDEISLQDENVRSAIYNEHGENIGIIKISNFYADLKCKNKLFVRCHGVSSDTAAKLKKLKRVGMSAILIDLRNNGGGDFLESIKLASLFIPQGVIVQTIDKNKYISSEEVASNMELYKEPLIVLVNKLSASASEIFAGAIQDYGRGIIVGDEHTYGKATVQVVQEMPGTEGRKNDGAIKVTQNKFYRPSGTSNQRVGVSADIIDAGILANCDIGEEKLDYALPQDAIASVIGFKPLQNLNALVEKLKKLSRGRLEKNSKYQELVQQKNNLSFCDSLDSRGFRDSRDGAMGSQVVQPDDVQMMEALAIAADSARLSRSMKQADIGGR
ncbi:MAG: carboxy terminal-processing peptidase [Bdellovibrionota bacterium]